MKYLLLLIGAIALVWFVRKVRATRRAETFRQPSSVGQSSERMVRCAHCGVNVPVSESVEVGGVPFCSTEHSVAGRGGQG